MESKDVLEEQLSEASSDLTIWRSFVKHAGWAMLCDKMSQQMEIRKGVVMTTPLNPDSNVYAQEFLKGQFSGIQEVLDFPQNELEGAQRLLSLLNVKLENHNEAEVDARPPRSRVDTDDHFGG